MNDVLDRPLLATSIADMRDPQYLTDPQSLFRRLRADGRVHRDTLGLWLLLGHADCRAAMQSPRLSRDPRQWRTYATVRPYLAESFLEQTVERFMLMRDAPFHTQIRGLMGAAFTPAAVRAMREQIAATCNRLVAALPADRPFDVLQELAQPLPVQVICDVLGIPPDATAQTRQWSEALALVVEPVARRELRRASDSAARELADYMAGQVARHRVRPSDSLLDLLIAGQRDEPSISDEDLLANLVLLFIAGHETTTNLIGNGLYRLLTESDALEQLRADPGLMSTAIDEMLRYDSPVTVVARVTREPWVIGDLTIPPGEMLYCMTGAANHDPAVFQAPERFDIRRSPNPHLSFGGGVHYCIGAPMARLEAQLAFASLFERFAHLRLAKPEVCWRPLVNLRGLTALWVSAPASH